jgi:FAD synthase
MKTLKLISLSILMFAAVAIASAKETSKLLITNDEDLRDSFREIIVSDFSESVGYLYKNNVSKLENKVEVTFYVTREKEVRVLNVKSNDETASDYIKQLLSKKTLNISNDMLGKAYKVDILLIYKAS